MFCRHCLNLNKEKVNNRGKPICFICDAAVSEITPSSERDKEIDDLYASLSVDERLGRARVKAERKVEEESFADRPTTSGSVGGGDASNSSSHVMDNNSTDDRGSEWLNLSDFTSNDHLLFDLSPIRNTGTFRLPLWREERHIRDQENTRELDADFGLTRFLEEQRRLASSSANDGEGSDAAFPQVPFPQPQPPIVIHHTIQHIHHHHSTGHRDNSSLPQSRQNPFSIYGEPTDSHRVPSRHDCRFHDDNRFRNSSPFCSPPGGYYHSYGGSGLTQSHHPSLYHPSAYTGMSPRITLRPSSYCHHGNVDTLPLPSTRPMSTTHSLGSNFLETSGHQDFYGNHPADVMNNECGHLCDFHRTMWEQENQHFLDDHFLRRTASAHSRPTSSGLRFEVDFVDEDNDSFQAQTSDDETNDSSDQQDLLTVSLTIPVSFHSDSRPRTGFGYCCTSSEYEDEV